MSYGTMKRNRKSLADLAAAANKTISGETRATKDTTYWKLGVDKAGNGQAIIRFLPAPIGEDLPWVEYHDHWFKGPTGQTYYERSLTDIGQQDALAELNNRDWNSGTEAGKERARGRKRKLHYVANILVIEDTAHPENEGKVFRYKFGRKIFEKLNDAMNPQYASDEPINPFCLETGANFRLSSRKVAGWINYDKSHFETPKPVPGSHEEIEKQLHSLQEVIDPSNYKTPEELRKRLIEVLGADVVNGTATTNHPAPESAPAPFARTQAPEVDDEIPDFSNAASSSDDEEDVLALFKAAAGNKG